jgi:hypothetical protein
MKDYVLLNNCCFQYINTTHSLNNMIVAFGLPALYVIFGVLLSIRSSLIRGTEEKRSKKQIGTFVQVLIINCVNVIGCLVSVFG